MLALLCSVTCYTVAIVIVAPKIRVVLFPGVSRLLDLVLHLQQLLRMRSYLRPLKSL